MFRCPHDTKMAIIPSDVELERRSRAQNVALGPAYHLDIVSSSKVILTSIWWPFWKVSNYSMQLRFDFRFVIYAPQLVELDSFEHDLFIFEPYLLLAKIPLKFCKCVRLTVCYLPKFYNFGKYVRVTVCLFVTCRN